MAREGNNITFPESLRSHGDILSWMENLGRLLRKTCTLKFQGAYYAWNPRRSHSQILYHLVFPCLWAKFYIAADIDCLRLIEWSAQKLNHEGHFCDFCVIIPFHGPSIYATVWLSVIIRHRLYCSPVWGRSALNRGRQSKPNVESYWKLGWGSLRVLGSIFCVWTGWRQLVKLNGFHKRTSSIKEINDISCTKRQHTYRICS